jgi:hypothetical protein
MTGGEIGGYGGVNPAVEKAGGCIKMHFALGESQFILGKPAAFL